jgi:DMSO/TMAO reductase YedYZ molybdopterin-dependent catalytic subunit
MIKTRTRFQGNISDRDDATARNTNRALRALLALGALIGVSHAVQAAPVSTQFTVGGSVGTPGATYNLTSLLALPPTTQTVTFTAGGTPTTDTYTGVLLTNLLASAGGITTDPTIKNDILRKYVMAIGSDGYQALIGAAEFTANFGGRADMVAYADTGGQLGPSGTAGFARMVVPGDVAGGRYVSNLVALQVGTAPSVPGTGGGLSTQFTLSGIVSTPGTYTLSKLQALPATTETATYQGPTGSVTDTYTGVTLWNLITAAGLITDPSIKNDLLRDYALVTGTDGYEAIFPLGEIDPAFGDQPDLVAYGDTGGQLGPSGPDGFARMVVPGDTAGGRYVSNIASIEIIDATVPEPSTIGLLLAGSLGLLLVRRRRNSAA